MENTHPPTGAAKPSREKPLDTHAGMTVLWVGAIALKLDAPTGMRKDFRIGNGTSKNDAGSSIL